MWRLSKALKAARLGALNRSSSCLWNSARHESSTSKDSDVKAEVPYKTLQVINAMQSLKLFHWWTIFRKIEVLRRSVFSSTILNTLRLKHFPLADIPDSINSELSATQV